MTDDLMRWRSPGDVHLLATGLVLSLNAGTIKAAGMPGPDFTVVSVMLAVGAGILVSLRRSDYAIDASVTWTFLVFALIAVSAALPVITTPYAQSKVLGVVVLTVPLCFAAVILGADRSLGATYAFLRAQTALGLVLTVALVAGLGTSTGGRTGIGTGNPLLVSRSIALAVACAAVLWSLGRLPTWYFLVGSSLAVLGLQQAGMRAPLFASMASLAAALAFQFANRKFPKPPGVAQLVLLLAGATVALRVMKPLSRQALDSRIALLVERQEVFSLSGRLELWREALEMSIGQPLGSGWGAYSLHASHSYPHNLVLEIVAETGVISGILFVVWVVVVLGRHWRSGHEGRLLLIPLFVALSSSLVAADINGNRVLFVLLFAGMASPGWARKYDANLQVSDARNHG